MKKNTVSLIIALLVLGGVILFVTQQKKQTPVQITQEGSQIEPTASEGIVLEIIEPKSGQRIVQDADFVIKGRTAPYAEVFVADQQLTADANGNFSTTVTLDEGENVIVVLANDAEGNFAEETIIITLE